MYRDPCSRRSFWECLLPYGTVLLGRQLRPRVLGSSGLHPRLGLRTVCSSRSPGHPSPEGKPWYQSLPAPAFPSPSILFPSLFHYGSLSIYPPLSSVFSLPRPLSL